MDRISRAATLAATFAFLVAFLEAGVLSEGLVWAIEDAAHLPLEDRLPGAVLAAILALGVAFLAARSARRFQTAQLLATQAGAQDEGAVS